MGNETKFHRNKLSESGALKHLQLRKISGKSLKTTQENKSNSCKAKGFYPSAPLKINPIGYITNDLAQILPFFGAELISCFHYQNYIG